MKLSAVFRKIPIFGTRLDRMLVLESGLFDPGYYLERYPDVTSDPLGHYLQHGALEMRDPSPFFRTRYYLEENPDVASSGINPLVHFILWGAREGRDPNPFFDSSFYLESNDDVRTSGANPLAHFIVQGKREGRDPCPRYGPRVHLYATCWNEIRLLDFFFRHYDSIVQRYVIFDEGSTDGSLDFLRGHPKVELRRFVRNDPDSFVLSELDLFNHCWKESRGFRGSPVADWVIICNIDEHIVHPDLGGYLSKCLETGITAIPALGYQMFVEEYPRPGEHLCETRTNALPDPTDCKLVVFSPIAIKEINFAVGGHAAQPTGRVIMPARDELLLQNYQILGIDYTLERFAELRTGLGQSDHTRGWGFHYGWTREEMKRMFARLPEQGVNTEIVLHKTWKNYPCPEWWKGFDRKHASAPPLLSIVTTVYDRLNDLESCIKSVRNLNFQDYEHIIVSDHPPREISFKIEEIIAAEGDPRIFLYNMPSRTNDWGISPAEFGLKKATGKYISFLDDDNGYLPNHFDALIDCLEDNSTLGFVYSSCLWNNEMILNASPPVLGKIDLGQVLFRRETFRDCINNKLNYSDYNWDWHLISDFISKGVTYKHFDQETFVFRLKKYPQFAPQLDRSSKDHINNLNSVFRHRDVTIGNPDTHSKNLEAENVQMTAAKCRLKEERAQSLRDIEKLKATVQQKDNRIHALENSLSWRLTAPLRWLGSFFPHLIFQEVASIALPNNTNDLKRVMVFIGNKVKSGLRQSSKISHGGISKVISNRSCYIATKNGAAFDQEAIREVLHGIANELKKELK